MFRARRQDTGRSLKIAAAFLCMLSGLSGCDDSSSAPEADSGSNGVGTSPSSTTDAAGPSSAGPVGSPGSNPGGAVSGGTDGAAPAGPSSGGGGAPAGADGGAAASGADAMVGAEAGTDPTTGGAAVPYHDPGTGPWEMVPESDLMSVCKLDLDKLKQAEKTATYPWLIVRYGKLCYQHGAANFAPSEAWSTTKTLGALVVGMVSYQTRMIPRTGKKTGQLSDEDDALQWLSSVTYNQKAKVAHVLAMVAHDPNLAWGSKSFAYDTIGTTEINSLGNMIKAAIAQDSQRLGTTVAQFTQKFLYEPLGMKKSSWAGTVFAYTWNVDLFDMARVGVLINNYGVWSGERLVSEDWIYRQTHPAFEDANTGFGYLTWLNSKSNWQSIGGGKQQGAGTPGTCAPVAIHKAYPHGVSEAKDCNYQAPATCDQKYDVGVWNAEGLGGQLIQGHRGLDMVIVARNAQPGGIGPGTAKQVWDALRPAVIAGDPMFKGDETAFCEAYGGNNYAPDLH